MCRVSDSTHGALTLRGARQEEEEEVVWSEAECQRDASLDTEGHRDALVAFPQTRTAEPLTR